MSTGDSRPKHRHSNRHTKQNRPSQAPPRVTVGNIIVDVVVTLSVLVLLFVAYTFFWSGVRTERVQDDARAHLVDQWNTPTTQPNHANLGPTTDDSAQDTTAGAPTTPTAGMAIMSAPRLGNDWAYVIFPGVDSATLSMGPGWYTESQQFGQTGNAAIAGHRDGAGAPFHNADAFRTCDEIIIETQHTIYTYRVLPTGSTPTTDMSACASDAVVNALASGPYASLKGSHIVTPTQGEVIFPVPMIGEAQPTLPLLTITTCHPIWSNAQRLITHAVLTNTSTK